MREGRLASRPTAKVAALASVAALGLGVVACGSDDSGGGGGGSSDKNKEVTIGLITKTETNPFFVKMKEGAQAQAKKDNVKLLTAAGKIDTDNASQVTAIENMIDAGRQGHPRSRPADTKAIVPAIKKARDAGVIGDRARHADRAAGRGRRAVRDRQPEGRRADRPVRQGASRRRASTPKIAMLDLAPGISVGAAAPRRLPEGLRHQGGRPADRRRRAARRAATRPRARPRWRTCLQKDPDINVVYTINEPTALGAAHRAEGGRQGPEGRASIVSVDGGCTGDQERRQDRHDRRDLAAVPAEDGRAGRRGGRGYAKRRQEAVRLHRHRRHPDHRQADGRRRRPRTPTFGLANCWG